MKTQLSGSTWSALPAALCALLICTSVGFATMGGGQASAEPSQALATPTSSPAPSSFPSPTPLPSPTPTPTPLPTPKISLINPSAYAGSRTISTDRFRIVASVDHPYVAEGVEIELVSATAGSVSLGKARRVALSETFELVWDLTATPVAGAAEPGVVADGAYTIRAKIIGTATTAEAPITVKRAPVATDTAGKLESVEIISPVDGRSTSLTENVTRDVHVTGRATGGTERVDLYYSTTAPGEPIQWVATKCGSVLLSGSTDWKPFDGVCQLGSIDNPEDLSAIAAVAWDCTVPACTGTDTGGAEGGDAVATSACWGSPCLTLSPNEWRSDAGRCQKVVVDVAVEGQPGPGINIDVQVSGPGKEIHFCDLKDSTKRQAPKDGGGEVRPKDGETVDVVKGVEVHHTEGESDDQGHFIVGIKSNKSSFKSIYERFEYGVTTISAWVDKDDDDVKGPGEDLINGQIHWDLPGRCTVVGTEGKDDLTASAYPDKICGMGGDDTIHGLDGAEGNDIILGGPGNDIIFGQKGNDLIWGGGGSDLLFGGDGNDKLFGGAGDDEISGERGVDQLSGGSGNDGCSVASKKYEKKKDGGTSKSCEREAHPPKDVKP